MGKGSKPKGAGEADGDGASIADSDGAAEGLPSGSVGTAAAVGVGAGLIGGRVGAGAVSDA
jgi:hypothetical protein